MRVHGHQLVPWSVLRGRRAVVVLGLLLATGVVGTAAWAYWSALATAGGGGATTLASVNQGSAPAAVVGASQAVTVSWPTTTLTDSTAASGYVVKRYDAGTNVVQTTGAGCTGTVAALTCTEAAVPIGNWKYTVTPRYATNWQGTESVKSSSVTVGSSVLTLAKTVFGAPLPNATTGTLTGFSPAEGITYRLDAATALAGSPATASGTGTATITTLTVPAGTADGAHTVYAVGAGGSLASFNIVVDTTAPVASAAVLSPAANGAGWNNTSPVSVTLAGTDTGGSGIATIRYTLDGTNPTSSGTALTYSGPLSIAATTTIKYYVIDAGGNASPVLTSTVSVDTTAPVNALTLSNITGNAVKTGNTVYYRGTATGSLTLTNTMTDISGSGVASSGTAALAGTSTGFSHTSGTVSTPAGGPFVSAPFSWGAATTSSPTETVTGTDTAGNTVTTTLTFVDDSVGPTGGSVDASGLVGTGSRYSTSTTLSIALNKGTDTNGPASTGATLTRATATLTSTSGADGVCGAYGAYAAVTGGTDPASPKSDTVTDQACYRYQYTVPDNLGNSTVYTSGDIKVDSTAPSAPTASFSALTNAYALGTTVYFRTGVAGGFTVTAGATDLASGIASYTMPALGTGWTPASPGTTGVTAYAFTNAAAAPGAKSITATNNAGGTGTGGSFTTTADSSQPTGGTVSYTNGYATAPTLSVTFTAATADTGSGLNATSGILQRAAATLASNGTCGAYGAYATVASNPTSPYSDTGVTSGNCYTYQYLYSDNVGNQAAFTSASVAKVGYAGAVNATTGLLSYWRLGEAAGTSMADSKGSNTGTYVNGPTLAATGALTGDTNTAVTFDGTNDYAQVASPTGVPVGATTRSVEMWFKTSSAARQTLFEYGTAGTDQEFGLYLQAGTNNIVAWSGTTAANDVTFTNPSTLADGVWHQVVTTYDGTNLAVYVNGALLGTQATTRSTVMDASGFVIGAALPAAAHANSGGYFAGALDEVSLYTSTLSATTIADHYNLAKGTDSLGPAGGSVDAAGLVGTGSRYSTSTSLSIAFSKGTDTAGVAATGATLTRATAALTSTAGTANGTCGAFGAYAAVTGGTDPASPMADTVADQACYRYRYTVADALGNSTTYTSGDIKVDTTAPGAPTLGYSALTNTSVSGNTVYYKSGATSGSVTVTAAATDTASGIASYAFAAAGANWTSTAGSTGVNTYSWSGSPVAAAGAKAVTAASNTAASTATNVTLTADGTGPTGGSVTHLNGFATGPSITVTLAPGTDAGAGLDATSGVLQRASAAYANSACGGYGAFATVASNPGTTYTDTNVTSGICYKYQYLYSDNLGNQTTYPSGSVTKVDYAGAVSTTTGLVGQWRLGDTTAVQDTFTDTVGKSLVAHTGETGATWTLRTGDTSPAAVTATGTLRHNGAGSSTFYAAGLPASPDYLVEADVIAKSATTTNLAGVVGRLNTAGTGTGTYYTARYNTTGTAAWELQKVVNGAVTALGSSTTPAPAVGQAYRLGLDLNGTTIRLLVDGVAKVTVTDSGIAAAGRAGVRFDTNSTAQTDTTGLHLDNFKVTPELADSRTTSDGSYSYAGFTLGATGALPADTNTAVTLNGTTGYGSIADTTALAVGDVLSVEAWVKRADNGTAMQTIANKGANGFYVGFVNNRFTLFKDGVATAIATTTTTQTDTTAFHHYVATKNGATVNLYVDGVDVTGAVTNVAIADTALPLSLGARAGSSAYLNGTLDEVALYGTALSATTVTNHYLIGLPDVVGPTGGSVDATGLVGTGSRYSTSTTLSIALAAGTDARSGLAGSGAQLLRATATLSSAGTLNGTCGAYGAYAQVGSNDPSTPVADTVAAQACYRYQYVVQDTLGNSTTYTSGDIKVDTTAPAASTFGFSALTNTYGTGSTLYYRATATSGSFTVTATATDTGSGIASYSAPTLGTGWTAPSSSNGVQAYSWSSANPTVPAGAQNVVATNNAGLTTSSGFTVVPDTTPPATGSVTYTDGVNYSSAASVSFNAGTDAGSGVSIAGGVLQRASTTYNTVTAACGASYSAFATVATGPTSPYSDSTIVAGNCYKYQYLAADNVGNVAAAYTSTSVAKFNVYSAVVLNTSGLVNYWRLGESSGTSVADAEPTSPAAGTYFNTPTLGVTGGLSAEANSAVTFTASNSEYATVPRQISDDYSVEFFFKSTQGLGTTTPWYWGAGLVDGDAPGGANDFGISLDSNGKIMAGNNNGSTEKTAVSTGGFNDGVWHHVIVTRVKSSGMIKIYIDGSLEGSGTGYTVSTNASTTLSFGRLNSGGQYLLGSLDEVSTYNRALTPAEVTNHYDSR